MSAVEELCDAAASEPDLAKRVLFLFEACERLAKERDEAVASMKAEQRGSCSSVVRELRAQLDALQKRNDLLNADLIHKNAAIAQLDECGGSNAEDVGSTPAGRVNLPELASAYAETCRHIEALELIQMRSTRTVYTHEAKTRAAMLVKRMLEAPPPCSSFDVQSKYNELLYAVAQKFPGESRHETALRYIREAECVRPCAASHPHVEKGSG